MIPTDWILPLLTLTAMEIVLGIDNIIFIAIVVGRLPAPQQGKARRLGLALALGTRLLLLFGLYWLQTLDAPLFALADLGVPEDWVRKDVSWRNIVLLAGGLFLIGKSVHEIHDKLEGGGAEATAGGGSSFAWTLVQIAILDIVFSLDSVITAIGMAQQIWIMVAAMIVAVGVMLVFAGPISSFVHRHPTLKVLALSFLILIGVMLVAEGIGTHIDRGYLYFAMTFALVVELLNLRMRKQGPPRPLHEASLPAPPAPPEAPQEVPR